MRLAVWIARAVLAAVFAASAFAKARDRRGTVSSAGALGVPAAATRPVAVALPALEAAAAVLVITPPTSVAGAVLAAMLLTAFTFAVGRTLRAGRRPACHCFGARSSAPIGADTIVRNVALLALAAVIVAGST